MTVAESENRRKSELESYSGKKQNRRKKVRQRISEIESDSGREQNRRKSNIKSDREREQEKE